DILARQGTLTRFPDPTGVWNTQGLQVRVQSSSTGSVTLVLGENLYVEQIIPGRAGAFPHVIQNPTYPDDDVLTMDIGGLYHQIMNANLDRLSSNSNNNYLFYLLMEAVRFDEVRDSIGHAIDTGESIQVRRAQVLTKWRQFFRLAIGVTRVESDRGGLYPQP
ncbi:unnamed protein product, partial [Aphanomyces euteiches]